MPGGKHVLGKINQQRVFGTAKVGDRGQIVIPNGSCSESSPATPCSFLAKRKQV